MLSIISTPTAEESDIGASVPVQDDPDRMARSLADQVTAEAPVEHQPTVDDAVTPATFDQTGESVPAVLSTPQDTEALATRLQALLAAVVEVDQLSRQAREAAASDLAHYDALVASRQLLEGHHQEARRIRQRAEQLGACAFGQRARVAAAPTLAEARELEQVLCELVGHRADEAAGFKICHPDVEVLVEERDQQAAEARRRQLEAERAERLADLVQAGELAVRQGALAEAQECLRRLKTEFPAEEQHIQALRTRLQQRAQTARDAAARAALELAAERQGRGDLEAAVTVLEQVEVRGLSVEVGEDVFGAWSQACSRLAQSACFDQGPAGSLHQALVRFAPAKGRGLILMRDPAVPYGLVVFSSLGMGSDYPRDKVVSDRLIVERARGFRRAAPLAEVGASGQSYVSWQCCISPAPVVGVERH
jgi:hypothetical protein